MLGSKVNMLYREDLEQRKCGHPGCSSCGTHLGQLCHPGRGLSVEYESGGRLIIRCNVCKAAVAQIAVGMQAAELVASPKR